ncbi:MAG: rhodanese-like domain-containing protein, partial [Ferruginibacter sp.]
MKRIIIFCISIIYTITSLQAQYKNDNILYKTVYPQELCTLLQNTVGYLLLDVRSNPEFEDTLSSSQNYNLGHLKNAKNINVRELGTRLSEIEDYKNKPVFVYCSHSQRSRRASKILADSGFTNIININSGLTGIYQLSADNCIHNSISTKLNYNIISAAALCQEISIKADNLYILDVRNDSAWRNITTDAKLNAYGHFKNCAHIALADLPLSFAKIPQNKKIVIVDMFGDEASQAAEILSKNNYKNISVLLEGIDRFFATDSKQLNCVVGSFISPVKFKILSTPDFKRFAETTYGYLTLDLRSAEEFGGKHKDSWRNIGHLVNALNIPANTLVNKIESIEKYKSKPVILYAFSSSTDVYEAANLLVNKGFTNVIVLNGGLFNIRWTAANVQGN